MRVLFYSPDYVGHYFAYLARMMPAFAALPIERLVATVPEALDSTVYSATLARFADKLSFVTICTQGPQPPVQSARHRLRELRSAIQQTQPDHVIVGYLDGLWEQALAPWMTGRRPWPQDMVVEGWIYRTRFGDRSDRRLKSRLRRAMFPLLLRSGLFRKLHLDGEQLYDFAKPKSAGTPTEVVLSPNPIAMQEPTSTDEARRQLGIATDGTWLSLSGMIARYKGADLLLEAYRHLRELKREENVRLLLAGPHEEQVAQALRAEPFRHWIDVGQIVSINRFVDDNEMFLAAAAADLVMAPYPNHHGRSSIILWAAAAGRPSLGTESGGIGYVIRQQNLGWTCDVANPATLAKSIATALCAPWNHADAARVREYAEQHRIEEYQLSASELVRSRLAK
ncbi:MAG TPA: glycosyltransferase [Lacipirellulaceae bacterium]|nr:glycosyltransferase [Lacipirellulaceae bacterium]